MNLQVSETPFFFASVLTQHGLQQLQQTVLVILLQLDHIVAFANDPHRVTNRRDLLLVALQSLVNAIDVGDGVIEHLDQPERILLRVHDALDVGGVQEEQLLAQLLYELLGVGAREITLGHQLQERVLFRLAYFVLVG